MLSLGNTPGGTKKLYMTMVIFWAVIMVYLLFAAVFISVKSVISELALNEGRLSASSIFKNQLFRDLLISLCSTYILYFVASFMFFEPWHMFTSVTNPPPFFSISNSLTLGSLVYSIPPPLPLLHQCPQRLRLLQHARYLVGYKGPRHASSHREWRRHYGRR